jgi:cell division protein FtsL
MSAGQPRRRRSTFVPMVLALAVMASALAVVQVKHQTRKATTQLDALRQERERLDLEWTQLQLEQATLAQDGRVDELARRQFGMVDPIDYQIVRQEPAHAGGGP